MDRENSAISFGVKNSNRVLSLKLLRIVCGRDNACEESLWN